MVKLYMVSKPHHKNYNALLNYKNITITDNIEHADIIYSPGTVVETNKPVVYGPHFSVFPDSRMRLLKNKNCVYIQPSQWVVDFWKESPFCQDVNIQAVPFGVDTTRFSPNNNQDKSNVLVYVKRRKPEEINTVVKLLESKNISFRVFDYLIGYNEDDFISYLKSCKFAIWISAHESQGFALEEALSCDVPILVWNVRLLSQEYRANYPDIFASSIPYWDERCGEVFYIEEELESSFNRFLSKLTTYKPRDYVLENLSFEKCEQMFLKVVNMN